MGRGDHPVAEDRPPGDRTGVRRRVEHHRGGVRAAHLRFQVGDDELRTVGWCCSTPGNCLAGAKPRGDRVGEYGPF